MGNVTIRGDRQELADAFARASRVIGRNHVLPVLQGVLCRTLGDRLEVTGSDSTLIAHISTQVHSSGDISFVAPGRLIADVLKRMPDGTIRIENCETEILVAGDGPEFRIRKLALEDYPEFGTPDMSESTSVDGSALLAALAQVTIAASTDSSRPVLEGVFLTNSEHGLRLVATDSYRLALRDIAGCRHQQEGPGPCPWSEGTRPDRGGQNHRCCCIRRRSRVRVEPGNASHPADRRELPRL